MFRRSVILSFCLCALAVHVASAGFPSYNKVAQNYILETGPFYQVGNLQFIGQNEYYNLSSHTINFTFGIPACGENPLLITSTLQIWCLNQSSTPNLFYLNLLNPATFAVQFAYPYKIQVNTSVPPQVGAVVAEDTIFILEQFSNPSGFVASAFDIFSRSFVCQNASIEEPGTVYGINYAGNYILYSTVKDAGESSLNYAPCNGNPIVRTKFTDLTFSGPIFSFNDSSVFVNVFLSDIKNKIAAYAMPFAATTTGKIDMGTAQNFTSFEPINDTHFIASYPNAKDKKLVVGLFTTTPNLEFLEVAAYHTGIPLQAPVAGIFQPVIAQWGTAQVTINIESIAQISGAGSSVFTFDFNVGAIVKSAGQFPAFYFTNGTVVNLTNYGYFYQTPGQGTQFIYSPINDFYQDPVTPYHIATIYVPSNKNKTETNKCTLVDFNPGTSTISTTIFPSCPTTYLSTSPNLKDLQYDSNGHPVVTYRDSFGQVYIVSTTQALGPYSMTTLYAYPAISINLTSGTGTFVGSQLSSTTIGSFYVNNGSVFNKVQVPGNTYNYVYKMNENYFMTAASTGYLTTFSVYSQTGELQSTMNASISLGFQFDVPVFVLGVSAGSPNYGGVVVSSNPPYIINPQGNVTLVASVAPLTVSEVFPNAQNGFFAVADEVQLQSLISYVVTSWTSPEAEEIEY